MDFFEPHDESHSTPYPQKERMSQLFSEQAGLESPAFYEVWLVGDGLHPSSAETVLMQCFHTHPSVTKQLLQNLEKCGSVECGTYTKETAETKVSEVNNLITRNTYSLKCIMKKGEKHALRKS